MKSHLNIFYCYDIIKCRKITTGNNSVNYDEEQWYFNSKFLQNDYYQYFKFHLKVMFSTRKLQNVISAQARI